MKSLLVAGLLSLLSLGAMAEDLPQKSILQVRYSEITVYEVKSVTADIAYTPSEAPHGFASYQGVLKVNATVAGNLCNGKASSVGTLFTREAGLTMMKLIAGEAAVDNAPACTLYGLDSEVTFTIPVLFFDIKHTGKLLVTRIPLKESSVDIVLTVNGSDIRADIFPVR